MVICLAALVTFTTAPAQDSTYIPRVIVGGDCDCPFELSHKVIDISAFTNLKIVIDEASTASLDDMYAKVIFANGNASREIYFLQGRIPEIGESRTIGPFRVGDKVDFRIFAKTLSERTSCSPNRWGEISDLGIGRWEIAFEDWCDFDWNDIIIDVSSVPGAPAVNILTPADKTSFVTDSDSTFRVKAEALATDSDGDDISRKINCLVMPSKISGVCEPSTNEKSNTFDFTAAYIEKRRKRGTGRLEYVIYAMTGSNNIALVDSIVMVQDDIDIVRQQYVDYHINMPYKNRFRLAGGSVIIPTERILTTVSDRVGSCYRAWAGDINARFELLTSYMSPDRMREKGIIWNPNSLHQYGLAIDIGYDDHGAPGKRDDSRAICDCIGVIGYFQLSACERPELSYDRVHVQIFRYWSMPYVERQD